MSEIILDFDEQDNPVLSVNGVKGSACKELTRTIEQKIGVVTEDKTTREFNDVETNVARISNRG